MPGIQSKYWCLRTYTEPTADPTKFRYLVWGDEKCPSNGRRHWQGYVEFHKKIAMHGVKLAFGDKGMNCGVRRESAEEASNYCKKEKIYLEHGTIVTQGQRTDLLTISQDLVSRKRTLDEVMEQEPAIYCRFRNGLADLAALSLKKIAQEFRLVNVQVLWGEPGSGKTRRAVEDSKDYYMVTVTSPQWWDGYIGQKTIIIDDYYGDWKWNLLLRILDGYMLQLPVKGGFTYAVWTKVIITSNAHPDCWYMNQRNYGALDRRLTDVIEIKKVD